jgi:preprotein translocase subunit SecD
VNRFSIHQYLLILTVLVLGFTYALPNLYPTQPSIQVAYTDSGKSADQVLLNELEDILNTNDIGYENFSKRK